VSTGSQYVVAAYAVIWFVLLLFVAVIATRSSRIAREVELLGRLVEKALPPEEDRSRTLEAPPALIPTKHRSTLRGG